MERVDVGVEWMDGLHWSKCRVRVALARWRRLQTMHLLDTLPAVHH